MSEMPFDPKLRAALKEIREVCRKYDCGGHIVLASPTHCEFAINIEDPSWSVIEFTSSTEFRLKHRAAKHSNTEATIHMLGSVRDMCGNAFMALDRMLDAIKTQLPFQQQSMLGKRPDFIPGEDDH